MRMLRGITIDGGGSEIRVLPVNEGATGKMLTFDNDICAIQEKITV